MPDNFDTNKEYDGPWEYQETGQYSSVPQGQPQSPSPQGKEKDVYAILALVFGIVSFFMFPWVSSIIAIVMAYLSKKNYGPNKMAKAGKICGIISLVVYSAMVVFMLICFGILMSGPASSPSIYM